MTFPWQPSLSIKGKGGLGGDTCVLCSRSHLCSVSGWDLLTNATSFWLVSPALGSRLTKLAHTAPSLEESGVPAHIERTFIQNELLFFSERGWLAELCCPLPRLFLPLCCLVDVAWRGSLVGSVGQGFAEASNEGKRSSES